MLSKPIAQPKPPRRLVDRVAVKRERDRQSQVFRDRVWRRDGGKCRACGRHCLRTLELVPNQGTVHHLKGRNVKPEWKYDPDRAVLLCLEDHDALKFGLTQIGTHQATVRFLRRAT